MAEQNGRRFGMVSFDTNQEREAERRKEVGFVSNTINLPPEFKFFRLPHDRSNIRIDILPFITNTSHGEELLYRYPYGVHRGFGFGFTPMICPHEINGAPCPICEYVRSLSWNNDKDKDKIRRLKMQQRQIYAVRWLDGPAETRDSIMIFDSSVYIFGAKLDERIRNRDRLDPEEASWDNFADLYNGLSLKLSLSEKNMGEGNGNPFVEVTAVDFKPRQQQYDESWLDRIPDLSKCLTVLDYDDIKSRFYAGLNSTSESDNNDMTPKAAQTNIDYNNGNGMNRPASPNYNNRGYNNQDAKSNSSYDVTNGYSPMVQEPKENQNTYDDGPMAEDDMPF